MKRTLKGIFLSLVMACFLLAPATALAAESWMLEEAKLWHVTDEADLLSDGEELALEEQAQAIEDQYGFGVYMITVDDYRAYSDGGVFETAMAIYKGYSLGVGPGKDGLLLLLSVDDRDYSLITYGDWGNYAFNDEGRTRMTEFFLDDFANDSWYDGFADYLEWSALYLEAAAAGTPYSDDSIPMSTGDVVGAIGVYLLAVLLIPLIISFIVIKVMDGKMKSVAAASQATAYVVGGLNLTGQQDVLSHVTVTQVPIPKQESGPSISHSGGFSGTSGKF